MTEISQEVLKQVYEAIKNNHQWMHCWDGASDGQYELFIQHQCESRAAQAALKPYVEGLE